MTFLHRLSAARAAGVALLLTLGLCTPTLAETHLLVMGGGGKPSSNQVSLEKNVNYFYRVIEHLGWTNAPRDIMFACGDDPKQDDLEYLDPLSDDPQVIRMINMLIGPGKEVSKKYRPHDIGGGEIASSSEHITQWFTQHATEMKPDDNLLLYFTGHGGRGEKKNAQNTTLNLWPSHTIRMQPFTAELDKLSEDTPVVMVMVQCFSGGFANVIFNNGDPEQGLSEHNRCGFFAAVHSRTAAGCTSHVNEADYKEYSSYFWAALSGEDRLGTPVDRPDYDGDGKTTYLEAHAYAMIHSDSTDLSMTTTDRLVRVIEVNVGDEPNHLLSQDSAYPDLVAAADPIRRAILDGLSDRLALIGDDRAAQARAALDAAKRKRSALGKQRRPLTKRLTEPRSELLEQLTEQWPALSDPKSEEAIAAVLEHAESIRQAIAGDDAFAALNETLDEMQENADQRDALTATIAHAERFLYTCESVAKIDTLLRFGEPVYFKAYYDLLAREMATPKP